MDLKYVVVEVRRNSEVDEKGLSSRREVARTSPGMQILRR